MRVLWITNHAIGYAAECNHLHFPSGTWMESSLFNLKEQDGIDLSVATTMPVSETKILSDNKVTYYCVPRSKKMIYPYNSRKCLSIWKDVIHKSEPDIIMIWGTEYAHGLCALLAAPEIPSVIVIQGILASVQQYYLGGMSLKELFFACSIRNFIKRDFLLFKKRLFAARSKHEKKLINLSRNIILENEWARAKCRDICPNCSFFEYRLHVNRYFWTLKWEYSNCVKHSIFCTSPGGYPIKGFHQLLKALAIVKKNYPDVQLRVPGLRNPFNSNINEWIKQDGYIIFIKKLIKRYDLLNNIVFLGKLNSKQIAQELLQANVFVVPSSIENQSISLREAMVVGTPTISSFVGGLPESIQDGYNGRLYRFEEYPQLAEQIQSFFKDEVLISNMSKNAIRTMRDYLSAKSDSLVLLNIYKDLLENNNTDSD